VAPLNEHLGALAVLERGAFWPLLFADPSQQPLAVQPAFADVALPLGEIAAWSDLTAVGNGGAGRAAAALRRYDYVLVTGPSPRHDATPAGLARVRSYAFVSLYRVVRR
jgi:hypothetical protein